MWKLLSVQDYSFSIFKDSTFKQSFTLKCRHDCVSPLRNKESEQRHNPTKVSVLAKWRKTRCSERCHAITLSKKACSVLYSISSNSTSYTCRCTQTFCAEKKTHSCLKSNVMNDKRGGLPLSLSELLSETHCVEVCMCTGVCLYRPFNCVWAKLMSLMTK